jgi:hypothetical protein
MSETSARASRFAFALGSLARNGLIGARVGVALVATGVTGVTARGVDDAAVAGLADRGVGCEGKGVDGDAEGVGRTTGPENGGVTGRTGVAANGRAGDAGATVGAAGRSVDAGFAAEGGAPPGTEGTVTGPRGAKGAGPVGGCAVAGRAGGAAVGAGRMNGGAAGRGALAGGSALDAGDENAPSGVWDDAAAGPAAAATGRELVGAPATLCDPIAGVTLGTTSDCGGAATVDAAVAAAIGAGVALGAGVAVAGAVGDDVGAGADAFAGRASDTEDTGGALREATGGTGCGFELARSPASLDDRLIVMTPPQTEQRARTAAAGTLSGSTRKTDRHSGQTTFIPALPWPLRSRGR